MSMGGNDLSQVRLIISDVDDTLVNAKDKTFYSQYKVCVEEAIEEYFDLSKAEAVKTANAYRSAGVGAEQLLFKSLDHSLVSYLKDKAPNFDILYKKMAALDPTGQFVDRSTTRMLIIKLRKAGVDIVALTNSPTILSEKILITSGYAIDDFKSVIGYEPDSIPPKFNNSVSVFTAIASNASIPASQVMAVGDKMRYDVLPAIRVGMMGCVIANQEYSENDSVPRYNSINDLFRAILESKESKINDSE